jgi:eukaryotic-like serine/threonine-protein kinase
MTPERYAAIRQLYEAVADLPADAQAARLNAADIEPALAAEVRAILEASDGVTRGRISRPVGTLLANVGAPTLKTGDKLGVWRVEGEIGHGGMGSVYRVERNDGHFTQTAALKFLRGLPSAERLDYFARERQTLANLTHPNIARLYDGGATDHGQPYLVMEFIDGVHVDQYCREQRLPTRAILKLFATACEAVAAAHRQLIVHCDIKPSNLLVNREGRPVLLDFGISTLIDKIAAAPGDGTAPASPAFTPRYASPEQRAGGAVTTASDIYSLGMLLAELLGNAASADAELAAIVGKATREDPVQRYVSVDALTDDIGRYLANEPLRAMPASGAYVAKRFLIRRWPLAVGVSIFIATVAGFTLKVVTESQRALAAEKVAVTERDRAQAAERSAVTARDRSQAAERDALMARDATARERDRASEAEQVAAQQRQAARLAEREAIVGRDRAIQAERQARDEQAKAKSAEASARQTSEFLLSVFDRANPGLGSGDPPASKLLDAAEERLETRLSGQPETQVLLYNVLGNVRNNMGSINQARKNYLRAIELERKQNRPLVLARQLTNLAKLDLTSLGGKQGEALAKEALELAQRHGPADSEEVAFALNMVGFALMSLAKDKEATPILQKSLAIGEKLDSEGSVTLDAAIYLAQNQMKLRQFEAAERYYRRALSIRAKLSGEGHPLWWTINEQLAMALRGQLKYADAEPIMRSSLAMRQQTHGRDSNESLRPMLALALLLRDMGRFREELELNRAAVEGFERTLGRQSVWFLLASNNLAVTLMAVGDHVEALRILREVVPLSKQAWSANHETPATFERNLGRLLGEMGLIDEARTHLRASLAANEIFYGAKHREPALVMLELALNEARAGDLTQAESHLQRYESMLPLVGLDLRVNAAKVRALVLAKRGEIDEALRAYAEVGKLTGEMHNTKDHRYWLSMVPRAELLARRGAGDDRAQAGVLAREILEAVTPVLVPSAPVLEKLRQLQPR